MLFANKSFDISKELGTQSGILESKILLAKINYQKNKTKSIEQLENVLETVSVDGTLEMKREVSELLYIGYKGQNRLDLSLKMYAEKTEIKISVGKKNIGILKIKK